VAGSRLRVQEEKHGLVVSNPHSRDGSRVHFDFDGLHVSWQHLVIASRVVHTHAWPVGLPEANTAVEAPPSTL
jgi:hypothetical protein